MSSITSDRFPNISEEDRKYLEACLKEGSEVTDLLEEDVASMDTNAPTTEGSDGRRKKRSMSRDDIEQYVNALVAEKLEAWQAEAEAPIPKPVQVRAAPPSLFNGKRGSFMFFARKLASYAKLTNVPDAKWVALAVQHLEERPLKVWDAFVRKWEKDGGEEDAIEWEDFKAFMSKRYDATDTVAIARQRLDKVYQGNESVERYIERFVALLSDVEVEYEMVEQDKLHLFLKGLNVQLRLASTINPGTGKPFTDLDDLCSFVVKYEGGFKSAHGDAQGGPAKRRAVSTFHTNLGAVNSPEEVPPFWGAVGGPPGAPGRGGKVDSRKSVPANRECYFCKQLGHEAWQCQLKKEWLAAKAKAGGFQPPVFQPGHYPPAPQAPPVVAPVQGGLPPPQGHTGQGNWQGKGKGKGKWKGKGKGRSKT
jgi:hypothetical protein